MFGIPLALPTRKRVVTIQVSFLLHRLRRRGEGEGGPWKPPRLPCPAPRQGALQAPWNPLLNSYKRVTNKTTGKMEKMQRLPLGQALTNSEQSLAYRRRSLNGR